MHKRWEHDYNVSVLRSAVKLRKRITETVSVEAQYRLRRHFVKMVEKLAVKLRDPIQASMQNFEPIFTNDGYRPNVGIIICNSAGQVFWARRINDDGWQFPQGGVSRNETLMDAMYRELHEETGLQQQHVRIVAHTKKWLHYDLPRRFLRNQQRRTKKFGRRRPSFKGQKQVWFLLELLDDDSAVNLQAGPETPEFDSWRWVDTHHAIDNIVDFKRSVYQKALSELSEYLPSG